jgi:hypothetical protein
MQRLLAWWGGGGRVARQLVGRKEFETSRCEEFTKKRQKEQVVIHMYWLLLLLKIKITKMSFI